MFNKRSKLLFIYSMIMSILFAYLFVRCVINLANSEYLGLIIVFGLIEFWPYILIIFFGILFSWIGFIKRRPNYYLFCLILFFIGSFIVDKFVFIFFAFMTVLGFIGYFNQKKILNEK